VRSEADRWLERWQSSSEAWTVANAVLHNPSSEPEHTYFCAQTLKTKVGLQWVPLSDQFGWQLSCCAATAILPAQSAAASTCAAYQGTSDPGKSHINCEPDPSTCCTRCGSMLCLHISAAVVTHLHLNVVQQLLLRVFIRNSCMLYHSSLCSFPAGPT
jgi:hypothetical protein